MFISATERELGQQGKHSLVRLKECALQMEGQQGQLARNAESQAQPHPILTEPLGGSQAPTSGSIPVECPTVGMTR